MTKAFTQSRTLAPEFYHKNHGVFLVEEKGDRRGYHAIEDAAGRLWACKTTRCRDWRFRRALGSYRQLDMEFLCPIYGPVEMESLMNGDPLHDHLLDMLWELHGRAA